MGPSERPLAEVFRQAISDALDAQGVTQVELAHRIGRSEKHVSFVLTGASGMSLGLAEKMAAALGLRFVVRTRKVRNG